MCIRDREGAYVAHLSNIEGLEMEGKLPEVRLATTPLKVVSPYEPSGDQPQAIEKLARGVEEGLRYQTLLGLSLIHISWRRGSRRRSSSARGAT